MIPFSYKVIVGILLIAVTGVLLSPATGWLPSMRQPDAVRRPEIGFTSRRALADHFQKHGQEFNARSEEQYLALAQDLRDANKGGPVLEGVRNDQVITRFDKRSGAFLAFNQDFTIRTFFKPNDGEAYYWRQLKR